MARILPFAEVLEEPLLVGELEQLLLAAHVEMRPFVKDEPGFHLWRGYHRCS